MKKKLSSLIAGCAIFTFVGVASAATYTVNMCGASAQAGFWQKAGAAVVASALNCTGGAQVDGTDDKHLIVRGQNCTVGGSGGHTVYVRYNAVNSAFGCTNYDCTTSSGWAVPGNCSFTGGFNCSGAEDAACMLGCADVDCETITAVTFGYAGGRKGAPANGGTDPFIPHGSASGYATTANIDYPGVVVPFGFIANNEVTDAVCVYDNVPANAHLAYDKRGWECDPQEVDACRGDYKCIDTNQDGTGVCMDGNQDGDLDLTITGNETACGDASDCMMNDVGSTIDITCAPQPLKNVSRLMVLHIFSDVVKNWQDFGPSFPNLPIVKCMRHGGSGTHQTLINTVFRGDAVIKNVTVQSPSDDSYVWHYKSSSDLTRDCVAYYDGAIGYVDADKVMFRSKIANGIHQLMYQGVAPSRQDVTNGKYNFWAAQKCFLDTTKTCYGSQDQNILNLIMTKAGESQFLDFTNFGQRAYFWATQDEMKVEKTSEYAYPNRK